MLARGNKFICVVLLVGLATAACSTTDAVPPAEQLEKLAQLKSAVSYQVLYRYIQEGDLVPGVKSTFELIQAPPNVLRRFETSTSSEDATKTFTQVQWFVARDSESFACFSIDHPKVPPTCRAAPGPSGIFGYTPVDEIFTFIEGATKEFTRVEAKDSSRTIAGEKTECFLARRERAEARIERSPAPEATNAPKATPAQGTPRPVLFDPTPYRYELCLSADGILLFMKRTTAGSTQDNSATSEMTLEATALERNVEPEDINLPADVVAP